MSIDFTGLKSIEDSYGKITQIADANGRVLWSAMNWPDDLDTGLEFASASAFSISVPSVRWDGTMEYCNGKGWKTWDGSEISSGETESGQCIYLRGTGNSTICSIWGSGFDLTGTAIKCNGDIGKLLDYATVKAGVQPTMADYCYYYLFDGCTALAKAPSLPATTLSKSCYEYMFQGCTSLTTLPKLPATALVGSCYSCMFRGCSSIKLSATQTGTYTKAYRIPYSGTGSGSANARISMFSDTGGTFTGTPSINTTYYLDSSNTIV